MKTTIATPAREILLGVLKKNKLPVTDLIVVLTLFQLCADDPMQLVTPARMERAMQDLCDAMGLGATVSAHPIQGSAERN